jgi:hypothetical protein
MVTFLTFYLGLVVGLRDFELAVDEKTVRVEIFLDGEARTEITAPPWTFQLDLGEVPLPHELTALAYDADGELLGQAFQRLNVSRPPVEVAIALTSEDGRVRAARLAWETVADEALSGVRVRLDGRKLQVDDPRNIPLPPLDMSQYHHLSAEVTFKGRLRTQTAVVFGGSFVDEVDSELTAVVVERLGDGESGQVPEPGEIAGWFQRAGTPLPVFAVERPPAEVMLVRDQESARKLARFAGGLAASSQNQISRSSTRERLLERRVQDLGVGLAEDDWLRVMATQPELRPETGKAFFQPFGDVREIAGGLGMGVAGLRLPADDRPERLADAVAASGLEVAGGGRRRMVLLVVDPATKDASGFTARQAELYLQAMRVPLAVWTAGDVKAVRGVWGTARDVSRAGRLSDAVDELMGRLDRQLVIWLEGRLLPTEIELSAEGLRHVAFPAVPLASGQDG